MKRGPLLGWAVIAALLPWGCGGSTTTTTATPVATATPTPTPAPTPSVTTQCNLPPVTAFKYDCRYDPPIKFDAIVARAQAQVTLDRPDLFDPKGRVNSQENYTAAVALVLRSYGYCAVGGTNDEVSIKNTNDYSELYDVVTSDNDTWTYYVFTCRPPLF